MRDRWSYQCEYVKCGKTRCRSCPHGPYWYGYRTEAGKTKKKYFGKEDPRIERTAEKTYEDPRCAIFNRATATMTLAREILGVQAGGKLKSYRTRFRECVKLHHPDHGGSDYEMSLVNAAWSYVKACYQVDY